MRRKPLRGRACLHELAAAHDENSIGDGKGFFLVVGDKHRGNAERLLDFADFLPDAQAEGGVEVGERLVQEQDFRLGDEGAGERDALLLAA